MIWINETRKRKNECSRSYDVRASVKAYIEARRKMRLSREVLNAEAEKLFSVLREYIRSRRDEHGQSFSTVLGEFYSEVLGLGVSKDRWIRSSLTRRFRKSARRYMMSKPRHQKTLDIYI